MVDRWQRYWFPAGGRWNAGVARLAVAASAALMLVRVRNHGLVTAPQDAPLDSYDAAGVLLLAGDVPPPAAIITACYALAWLGALGLLVGAWTRFSAAVALVASLVVVSFTVSFTPDWPHDNNLPLLALVAVQGTRGGDVAGVDGWLRRRRGLPPPPANAYEWTPRLVQLVCALVFLSAFASKLGHGRGTAAWALSDNLRHQILSQFDLNRLPRTALADWLLESPWRYRTAGVLNLVNQLLPIFAAVMVHRPRLRAAFGAAFAVEVLAIGVVMGLWNLHWLPLAAVFVDWDRLATWVRRRPADATVPGGEPLAPRARRRVSAFIASFLAYDVLVSFMYPRIDQRLRTYPFSAFPMFAVIRARQPYDVHLDYAFVHGRFRIVGAGAQTDEIEAWLHTTYAYRRLYRITDPEALRARMARAFADVRRRYPGAAVTAVQLWACIYHVPAYPAPARLEPHDVGLMGELADDGTWTSGLGGAVVAEDGDAVVELRGPGRGHLSRLTLSLDSERAPRDLPFTRDGDRVRFHLPDAEVVLVTMHVRRADGSPLALLLARRTRKAWW